MRKLSQRTEAVIRLDSLTHNVKNICGRLHPGCQLMAVLKGDGYGHGIAGIYPALKAAGVLRYAVAIWEEGVALRNAGCNEPVLILGDTCDDMLEMVVKHRLIPTIFSVDTAEKLNRIATQAGVKQPVHIKIDTGMSRIGFQLTILAWKRFCGSASWIILTLRALLLILQKRTNLTDLAQHISLRSIYR